MNKMLASLALCVAATTSSAATLTFTETEFRDSDVSFELIAGDDRKQVLTSTTEVGRGGVVRIDFLRAPGAAPRFGGAADAVLIDDARIDLSRFTPTSFDFSIFFRRTVSNLSPGTAGFVLKQGDNFFGTEPRSPGLGTASRLFNSFGLTADDFQSLTSETAVLDLSAQGADIQLGFFGQSRGGIGTGTAIFDNFSVTVSGAEISPVPLPASIPLLATGVGVLAALRRRNWRKKAA
ncbi:VPLPA-CTERM sorting domain-containing protein [Epibacterium ulvae]|uniref:VPLPA-CTERM sorting domain-containing protein n=1 Tax=Epibacterium ulvae TaxID=1156985 RepID=UPI001BFC5BA4|nr:VPLPA-CTERM sorting domain-containing protein [Epibacterium ulvae]MBT8155735.1 VPLPA-CTERM sorting domain-containing protein [Epibacterium ulvae]